MAAGERLGGLAPATRAAAQALAAAFDVVVIETVGVGQSETEVAEAADTVAVIVQPGSGDALQFLKAGIMEVPDALVVTKADLGVVATRAVRDLRAALRSLGSRTPVLAVSSVPPVSGVDELIAALDAHREGLDLAATRVRTRRLGALADFVAEHGARGLRDARRAPSGRAVPGRSSRRRPTSRRWWPRSRPARSGLGRGALRASPRSSRRNTPRSVSLPALWPPFVVVSTATDTRSSPRVSSATWWSTSPRPLPQPPLKYAVHPRGMTSPMPQRWVWTTVRSSSIA